MSVRDLIDAGRLTPGESNFDWDRAESLLGISIPEDYRALVDAGGGGLWFDYIRIFAPSEQYQSQNLLDSMRVFNDLLLMWEDDPETRPADLPEDARLIAWANTANGEMIFWRIDPRAESDSYPIYVENADGEEWERFDMRTSEFLVGIMRGELSSQFFSDTYLQVDEEFRPHTEL